ncbi:hypothetical protein Egran_06703, partial [Elaphomyces granulatus]
HLPGGACAFGGIPTVLGGDFQQTLPIVRHGNRADSVQACLQFAKVWLNLIHLRLRRNMRLSNATLENNIFATWLGKLSSDPAMIGDIAIPQYIHRTSNDSEFLDRIYPKEALLNAHNNPGFFVGRAILSTRNVDVNELNEVLLERLSGAAHTFDSFDHADLNDNALGREEMTAEYLWSITLASLPLGSLQLRIGAPLMLMRNLDPQHGLCNGTRMTLLRASRHCLDVRLNGGQFDGQCRLIYRCSLSTSEDLAFHLTRTQFPVKLAFAMTINKSQGQSLDHVGIDLRRQVFAHGQLSLCQELRTPRKHLLRFYLLTPMQTTSAGTLALQTDGSDDVFPVEDNVPGPWLLVRASERSPPPKSPTIQSNVIHRPHILGSNELLISAADR